MINLIVEEKILKKGTEVKVAHPAKGKGIVTGKIVRYDKGGPHSPFYIVDIGERQSEKVPAHKIKEDTSVASVDMNTTGKPKKRKTETFSVSDDCFHRFKNGKTKFERWSKYLDLTDGTQKKIYDWAKRHHNGTIILKNSQTGQVRGIRYNRTGGGQWGKITRLKEQVLETNQKFTVQ